MEQKYASRMEVLSCVIPSWKQKERKVYVSVTYAHILIFQAWKMEFTNSMKQKYLESVLYTVGKF